MAAILRRARRRRSPARRSMRCHGAPSTRCGAHGGLHPPARADRARAVHPGPTRRYAPLISVHARACMDQTALSPRVERQTDRSWSRNALRSPSVVLDRRRLQSPTGTSRRSRVVFCRVRGGEFCVSPRLARDPSRHRCRARRTRVSAWLPHEQMSAKLLMNGEETREPSSPGRQMQHSRAQGRSRQPVALTPSAHRDRHAFVVPDAAAARRGRHRGEFFNETTSRLIAGPSRARCRERVQCSRNPWVS